MSTKLKEWTVLSMLEWGTQYFEEKGIPDPRLSMEWLVASVLDLKRLDLYLKFDRPLSQKELNEIRPMVKRRAAHEPLQYIIGFTEFMDARIEVTPDVLIPRIETEQLVEIVLENHRDSEETTLLDIGTGSGCIPIALKKEMPGWEIKALDISEQALHIARRNAELNDCAISFFKADILKWHKLEFENPFDIVISNPPYVLPEEKKSLEKQVLKYEPSVALFFEDIKMMYRNIVSFSEQWLKKGGVLYLEIHELYANALLTLFDDSGWNADLLKDYEKKSRFIIAEKHF